MLCGGELLGGCGLLPLFCLYLENFVHSKVHSLYNVSAIVENSTDILRVNGTCKMWVTVVCIVLFAIRLTALLGDLKLQKRNI